MARVSVIVTSLNRAEYLREACSSVLSQDFDDLEVLICDDASDLRAARDAAQEIAGSDSRVRVMQNERRLGQFKTICGASELITGEYFAILNDDDRWEPGFLPRLVPPLESDPELVAAFCDHNIMDADGAIDETATAEASDRYSRADLRPGRHDDAARLAFELSAFPTVVGALYRRDAVDWDRYRSAPHDVIGYYDLWLGVCTLHDDAPVWFEPQQLSSYRVHSRQLSRQRDITLTRAQAWIWEEALDGGTLTSVTRTLRSTLSLVHHALGMAYLRAGNYGAAREYLRRALPRPRSAVGLVLTRSAALRRLARI